MTRNRSPKRKRGQIEYTTPDLPIYEQYPCFLGNLLRGDLGPSYKYSKPAVGTRLFSSFPRLLRTRRIRPLHRPRLRCPAGHRGFKFRTSPRRQNAESRCSESAYQASVLGPILLMIFSSGLVGSIHSAGASPVTVSSLPSPLDSFTEPTSHD